MAEIKEIREFKNYITKTRHAERIKEQNIDQTFFDDTFTIPHASKTDPKKEEYEVRSGFVADMSSGFTEQLISSVPKVFTKPKLLRGKISKEREEAADRIAALCNKWSYQLSKQSHNPFKQTFKYLSFLRGEAWIYIPHRPDLAQWEGKSSWQEMYPDIIPVHFILVDPLVVFHEPTEDVDGQPTRVLCSYKRLATDIHTLYPHWSKYDSSRPDAEIDFMLYVDKDTIYAEADEEALFTDKTGKLVNEDGRRSNLYGCMPFAHVYSGWGTETANKAPDKLAYSRTRMIRGRVEEDAAIALDFAYNIHATAWKFRTIITAEELGADFAKEYHPEEPGRLSILVLPPSARKELEETQVFDAPVFAYRDRIKADLAMAYPAPLRGIASGSSGRQEDILSSAGLSFYDCAVENNSTLWAEAFLRALKISYALSGMLPPELQVGDLDSLSEIKVNTRRSDPLESLRKAADGDRKYQLGIIDLKTNLIEYQGKTQAEAKEIMAALLVDDVTRNHPVFRELMGITLAREMGVEDEYNQMASMEKTAKGINPTPQFGSQGGEPREGNVKTPLGQEMMDMSLERPPRRAPAGV